MRRGFRFANVVFVGLRNFRVLVVPNLMCRRVGFQRAAESTEGVQGIIQLFAFSTIAVTFQK